MSKLPPEDQPDAIWIGPIGPIPVVDDDDPRFEEERVAWSVARAKAQALHSADELLAGLNDPDWRVRHESVDRLVARWKNDPRTVDAVLKAAATDPVWQVRAAAVMRVSDFEPDRVRQILLSALQDGHQEVRWSAKYVLGQLGLAP
jgi:HEAT repeat protein